MGIISKTRSLIIPFFLQHAFFCLANKQVLDLFIKVSGHEIDQADNDKKENQLTAYCPFINCHDYLRSK
jgi:hypothetical protein